MPSDKGATRREQNRARRQEPRHPLSTPGAVSGAADINMTLPPPPAFSREEFLV